MARRKGRTIRRKLSSYSILKAFKKRGFTVTNDGKKTLVTKSY